MSPTKKLILSIGGAILGHVVLLGLIAGLLVLSLLAGPPDLNAALIAQSEPKEITISFSDLIEKMEVQPPRPKPEEEKEKSFPEPEPEKEEEKKKQQPPKPEPESEEARSFVRTFADQEVTNSPENASAESDRNTVGASTSAPDPNDPEARKNMPNQEGEDLPFVMLRDRQFIDGEFLDQESGGASSAAAASMSQPRSPVSTQMAESAESDSESSSSRSDSPDPFKESKQASEAELAEQQEDQNPEETDPDSPPETEMPENAGPQQEGDRIPRSDETEQPEIAAEETMKSPADLGEESREGPVDASLDRPADADRVPTNPGPVAAQPNTERFSPDARMAAAEKSFLLPLQTGAPVITDTPAPEDEIGRAQRKEKIIGAPTALEAPKPLSTSMAAAASAPLPPPATDTQEVQQDTQKAMDQRQSATQPQQLPPVQAMPIPQPGIANPQPINPTAVQNERPSFLAEMSKTKVSGTLSNVKKSASFDAEKTPLGQYKSAVSKTIERTWHRYRMDKMDAVTWGSMKIKFRVDRNGKVRDLEMVKNKANTIMAEFTLRAILDSDLPKMPNGIADLLGPRGLEMEYDIFIH